MNSPEPAAAAPAPAARGSRAPRLALIACLFAAALAALFWIDARNRIGATQEELARRLRDIEADSREARAVARQAQEALRETQVKLGQLEARFAESQSQQLALEARAFPGRTFSTRRLNHWKRKSRAPKQTLAPNLQREHFRFWIGCSMAA